MATTKYKKEFYGDKEWQYKTVPDGLENVGLVVAILSSCDQIMSDVWATGYTAVVWNTETKTPKYIHLGNDEFGYDTAAKVDAPPAIMAEYKAYEAEKARLRAEADRIQREKEAAEREEAERKAPHRGRLVKFVSGRPVCKTTGTKITMGTTGLVIWEGAGDSYGWNRRPVYRVGVAISDRLDSNGRYMDVVWTNANNVEALETGNTPEEVRDRLDTSKKAWKAAKDAEKAVLWANEKSARDAAYSEALEEIAF